MEEVKRVCKKNGFMFFAFINNDMVIVTETAHKIDWLNFHYYCCEKPEFLGASNHLLFIGQKN
jgi:hypothetical protein